MPVLQPLLVSLLIACGEDRTTGEEEAIGPDSDASTVGCAVEDGLVESDLLRDADLDGYAPDGAERRTFCGSEEEFWDEVGNGWTLDVFVGDCDDADPEVYPGAVEGCNEKDDDCDGTVDLGTAYVDNDGDGMPGTPVDDVDLCAPPDDVDWVGADCDDADDAVFPGASEVCGDGLDNDCDGYVSCYEVDLEEGGEACTRSWVLSGYTYDTDIGPGDTFEIEAWMPPSSGWQSNGLCGEPFDLEATFMLEGDLFWFEEDHDWVGGWTGTWDTTAGGDRYVFESPTYEATYDDLTYTYRYRAEVLLDEIPFGGD